MVKSLLVVSEGNIDKGTTTAGATLRNWLGTGHTFLLGTENRRQITFRSAGVISHLFVRVTANTTNGDTTLITRKNAANGNLTVTIGAGATGVFEDTTHTDTVAAGDLLNYQHTATGTTGTLTMSIMSVVFNATTNCVSKFITEGYTNTTPSQTQFLPLSGDRTSIITTESIADNVVRRAGTAKNLMLFVQANARTNNTVFMLRKNGVDTALTLTVGAGATGIFEDTTHSVSVAQDDKLCWSITYLTGTESQTFNFISFDFQTTTQHALIGAGSVGASADLTVNANLTRYIIPGGGLTVYTTEASAKLKTRMQMILTNLAIKVRDNTVTASSTLRIRINGAYGNQTITIPASTTGYFYDNTNLDLVDDDDEIDYELVTGATGTSMIITQVQVSAAASTKIEKSITESTITVGAGTGIRQKALWRLQP